MKKFIRLMLLAGVFAVAGCADEYYRKIDELQERVEELQRQCDQINGNLSALRELIRVLESYDMISGITELRSGSSVTGYRINFVQHESVTIYNGKDGQKPLVASQQDPTDRNWYWAVQYGEGSFEWLLAPDGTRMLSVGVLPYVTIRDGWFCYTVDGQQWTQLAKADGQDGDQLFRTVDTRSGDYVVFTLANGTQFKIPTYQKYLELKTELGKINDNADAQISLLTAQMGQLLYIRRVAPLLSEKDTVGLTVTLSDGKSFRIYDWTGSISPAIFVKKDSDGKFYWAYTIGPSPEQWVLSPEGEKISASSEAVQVPQVSVERDQDGQYYWTVTTGDSTEFLRVRVGDQWSPRAVDSVARVFSSVTDYADSLVIVLRDSTTRFVLPKQYTVSLTKEDGTPVDGPLMMRGGQQIRIRYVANGPSATLTLVAQGGFSATTETTAGGNYIRIKAPASFPEKAGKILAVFSFSMEEMPVTVIKTILIEKEG